VDNKLESESMVGKAMLEQAVEESITT